MDQKEVDLLALSKTIWKWKKKIVLFVFIATLLSIGVSLLLPKWYKAKSVVLAPQASETGISPMANILGNLGLSSVLGGNENIFRYLAILKSRSLAENVIERFDLQKHYKCKNMELTLEALENNLFFEVGDESQIEVSMLDKNQELVADMTNYVVQCLDSLNIILSISNARNNRIFMEKRVNNVLDSLEFVSQRIAEFMQENGILSLEDQVTVGVEQAALLRSKIIEKEVKYEVAMKSFGSDNPTVNLLKFELQSLNRKYSEFINNNSISKLIPNFSKVPELQLQLVKLQRQVEYYSRLIQYLGPLYEQQKFEEAKNIPTLQVLDYAKQPELKAKPKRAVIVIVVFIISSILAVSYIITKESVLKSDI
ncbi:MAG: Wzz/FepE/Etk N-terminal domain-containing protein [Candidatus Neomarinimicrobiota bacterium]